MSATLLTVDKVTEVFSKSVPEIKTFFSEWNDANARTLAFDGYKKDVRNKLGEKLDEFVDNEELTVTLINTIRLFSRDKTDIDCLMNPSLGDKILAFGGLPFKNGQPESLELLMEAQKCLINTLFNSEIARNRFLANPESMEILSSYFSEFHKPIQAKSQHEWIRNLSEKDRVDIWYFYMRVGFIATVIDRDLQLKLAETPSTLEHLLPAIEIIAPRPGRPALVPRDLQMAEEAFKTFFNIYCHFQGDVTEINKEAGARTTRALRDIICSPEFSPDTIQGAVNCLSCPTLPIMLEVLCVDPKTNEPVGGEYKSMVFTEALLSDLEKRLKEISAMISTDGSTPSHVATEAELLGPYFQALARLCVESKHARRYCRLRILPPLSAEEVQKRPEEQNSLRGMIIRVMMLPCAMKEVTAEFLFIICKRSVPRMIKYVGFGHSAGHLANSGLLGQLNLPRHASDSEDSETEEYSKVKDSVNPVTGAVYPPDRGSALAGMSEEQREFEAMKLVDAMNKMMDAGLVKPGTIGEDGRLREVSHVLELIKNAPEPEGSGSDSD